MQQRRATAPVGHEVVTAWWRAANRRLGVARSSWYHPACTELVTQVLLGRDLGACERYGRARGGEGWSFGEVVDDLDDLRRSGRPVTLRASAWIEVYRRVGEAWVEDFTAATAAMGFRDPATGLPAVGFFDVALERLYEEGELGGPVPSSMSIVVVRASRCSFAGQVIVARRLAPLVRQVLGPHACVAVLGPRLYAVLVAPRPDLYDRAWVLAQRLNDPEGEPQAGGSQVWVEPLPPTFDEARGLLASLVSPKELRGAGGLPHG